MIDKEIYSYSNVELLDLIKNGINKSKIRIAESEFSSRNLSTLQKAKIESEYLKYIKLKRKRKEEPLTQEEWLSFLFLPFFATRYIWKKDPFSESELERFRKYGFEKKHQQASKIITYGYIFWVLFILSGFIIYTKLK